MTCCLFLARLHAQHDLQFRPTKWENKGVFCRQHNPLPFLLGQPAVNGVRARSKTAHRTCALFCRWTSLARADSPVNFGGTGSNARSRIGILAGLLLILERILPIFMYTGQAFLSPEELVRCVWLENPIMGTTVDPAGKAFYQGMEWAVSTGNTTPRTCQDLSHTCISHHQSAVCISEYNRSPLESYSRIGA